MKRGSRRAPLVLLVGSRSWLITLLALLIFTALVLLWWRFGQGPAKIPDQPVLAYQAEGQESAGGSQQESIGVNEQGLPESSGKGSFVDYRLQREQTRQETREMLEFLLNSDVNETRKQAEVEWLELIKEISLETEIENILKVKGFSDVIANIGQDNVSVVIYGESLTPEQVSLIQDAVIRIYPVRLDKIAISLLG